MYRIEALLSARIFCNPQRHGNLVTFISDLSGRLSLYGMDARGSVPYPLLPPHISLHNPKLLGGHSHIVFPDLGRILVMIDHEGDERYQPRWIPIDGGFPEPAFPERFRGGRFHITAYSGKDHVVYLSRELDHGQGLEALRFHAATGDVETLTRSRWGSSPDAFAPDHRTVLLVDEYLAGDRVLYLLEKGQPRPRILFGTPLEHRDPKEEVPRTGFASPLFTPDGHGILVVTALFDDAFGVGLLDLNAPGRVTPVPVTGLRHEGWGEMVHLHRFGSSYGLEYNIDGCSWLYVAKFVPKPTPRMEVLDVLCGEGDLADGTLQSIHHDLESGTYILSFSSATSPSQLLSIAPRPTPRIHRLTRERVLGVPASHLSPGEDASFTSFDGERISARLYLPAPETDAQTPFPLVYYIHGGPQSQERPDFTWFSMPLIQFLTLRGFAVFVPNARGSTGYGLRFSSLVDNDWGGGDRRDHVTAMKHLARDPRIDTARAAVMGRSYGGFMTLTLIGRHPELWSAAVDMFGVYDLLRTSERIPDSWKPYFRVAVGDTTTEEGRRFLAERSPRRFLHQLACPLLVIQGANDPRVVAQESQDLVDDLRAAGKQVEYLLFEDEGHDVLKFGNRVRCYNRIADFFGVHLQ